jgi:hypothetical protein
MLFGRSTDQDFAIELPEEYNWANAQTCSFLSIQGATTQTSLHQIEINIA